jgi:hypothetical protein
MIKNGPWLQQSEVNSFNNINIIQQQLPRLYLLKVSKFQKQIFLFSFPPKTKQKWELEEIYWPFEFEQKFSLSSVQTRLAWTHH